MKDLVSEENGIIFLKAQLNIIKCHLFINLILYMHMMQGTRWVGLHDKERILFFYHVGEFIYHS